MIVSQKVNPLISWLIVLLFPLYSLPWVLYRMTKMEKTAFVQFAFFMGLVGILYPPSGDLYRYYKDYITYQNLDWDYFLLYALVEFDYFLSFLLYFCSSVGIPCDITRFIFNFLGFFLLGDLYLNILNKHSLRDNKKFRIRSLIIFFVFAFSAYLYRSSLACILFIYGAFFIIYKKKKRYWFFVGLAILTHFSYVLFALLLLAAKIFPIVIRKKIFYILLLSVFLFGIFNVGVLFNIEGYTGAVFERYQGYMDVNDGGKIAEVFSWKNLIWQRFVYFITLVLLLFFIKYRTKSQRYEWSFLDYLLIICLAASPFSLVFGRFVAPLALFLKIFLLRHYDGNSITMRKYIHLLFCLTLILDGMNIWAKRHELSISDMPMLSYSTSFQVLTHTYSDKWVDRNITPAGDLVKYAE